MGVNFTDKDQNSISLMNVRYYDSKADYIREYTEVYEVFIIGGSVYVNQD